MQRAKLTDRPCLTFLLGAALLFAQYVFLRRVVEFYPSISLPAGNGLVRDTEEFSTNRWLVFAVTSDDARIHVDENELLSELPSQYRSAIMERGFGLLPDDPSTTDEEAAEARAWLRSRLHRQIIRHDVSALEIVLARYNPFDTTGPKPHLALKILRVEL